METLCGLCRGWMHSEEDTSVMEEEESHGVMHRIEITGDLDPHATEALYLEIRRLVKRYGVAIKAFRIEKTEDEIVSAEEDEE